MDRNISRFDMFQTSHLYMHFYLFREMGFNLDV